MDSLPWFVWRGFEPTSTSSKHSPITRKSNSLAGSRRDFTRNSRIPSMDSGQNAIRHPIVNQIRRHSMGIRQPFVQCEERLNGESSRNSSRSIEKQYEEPDRRLNEILNYQSPFGKAFRKLIACESTASSSVATPPISSTNSHDISLLTRIKAAIVGSLLVAFSVTPFEVAKIRMQLSKAPMEAESGGFTSGNKSGQSKSVVEGEKVAKNGRSVKIKGKGNNRMVFHFRNNCVLVNNEILLHTGISEQWTPERRLTKSTLDRIRRKGSDIRLNGTKNGTKNGTTTVETFKKEGIKPEVKTTTSSSCRAPPSGALSIGQQSTITRPGTFRILAQVLRNEGFGALYSPLVPTLLMAVPNNVIYFVAYEKFRDQLNETFGIPATKNSSSSREKSSRKDKIGGRTPNSTSSDDIDLPNQICRGKTTIDDTNHLLRVEEALPSSVWFAPPVAGMLSRVIAVFATAPFEIVRTKLGSSGGLTLFQVVKETASSEGIAGYFRGLVPSLWRDVPFSGMYWVFYEFLRPNQEGWDNFFGVFRAGFIAGAISSIISHPMDVIKSRWQVEEKLAISNANLNGLDKSFAKRSIVKSLIELSRDGGLFAGLAPRLMRTAPACGIMITSYELVKRSS